MFEFPYDYTIYLNALLALLFVFVLYRGYKRGMLLQIVGLISTFVSLIIAWIFSDVFVAVFQFVNYSKTGITAMDQFVSMNANRLIWFVILFVVIRLLMMVLTPIAAAISKLPLIKQVNSVMGGVFSILTFFIYTILIIFFLSLPVVTNGDYIVENTFLRPIKGVVVPTFSFLEDTIEENDAIQSLIRNRGLSMSQKQTMIDLLQDNGFTQDEIKEFLDRNE